MTNRIDRLAARDLVERHPDPADRRGVMVRLTTEGATKADAALIDLLQQEHAILVSLDDAQRAQLANLLRSLVAPFDRA
jgi:DNA-binding MarR family transcriptional regulator